MDLQKYKDAKTFDEKVKLLHETGCNVTYRSAIANVICHQIIIDYPELPHMSICRTIGNFGDSPTDALDKIVNIIKETLELL